MKNNDDAVLLDRQRRIDADRKAQAILRRRQRARETAAAMARIARTDRAELLLAAPGLGHCRCCEAAAERGDIPESHLRETCPHPACDFCGQGEV